MCCNAVMQILAQLILLLACVVQLSQTGYAVETNGKQELETQIVTSVGSNVTLPCTSDASYEKAGVYWVRQGKQSDGEKVLDDGSLFLSQIRKSDTTLYTCYDEKDDQLLSRVSLYVRGPPDSPTNVSVTTSIRHSVITWHQKVNSEWEQKMGGAITSIHLRYRKFSDSYWKYFPQHIPPAEGELNIYLLEPNTNYEFELWSQNKYGTSSHVPLIAKTLSSREIIDISHSMILPSPPLHVDAKTWLTALVAILFVINMFVLFMIAIYCRKGRSKPEQVNDEYSEHIELVPNIIENPVCNVDPMLYEDTTLKLLESSNKLSTFM